MFRRNRQMPQAALDHPRMTDGANLALWRRISSVTVSTRSVKTSRIVSGMTSGKISGKIANLMHGKPDIAIPGLARRLKRTERTIERQINRLKSDEIIGRVGPAKGGLWEVLQ